MENCIFCKIANGEIPAATLVTKYMRMIKSMPFWIFPK